MPLSVVKTPRDEALWEKAKALASKSGREEDYAYIMGIYKKMKPDHKFKKTAKEKSNWEKTGYTLPQYAEKLYRDLKYQTNWFEKDSKLGDKYNREYFNVLDDIHVGKIKDNAQLRERMASFITPAKAPLKLSTTRKGSSMDTFMQKHRYRDPVGVYERDMKKTAGWKRNVGIGALALGLGGLAAKAGSTMLDRRSNTRILTPAEYATWKTRSDASQHRLYGYHIDDDLGEKGKSDVEAAKARSRRHEYEAARGLPKTASSVLRRSVKIIEERVPLRYASGFQRDFFLELNGKRIGNVATYKGQILGRLEIDPKYRGMGLGKKFLGEVIRLLPKQTVHSGSLVGEKGKWVYEGMSKRKGYTVQRRPATEGERPRSPNRYHLGRSLESTTGEPVYSVSLPSAAAKKPDKLWAPTREEWDKEIMKRVTPLGFRKTAKKKDDRISPVRALAAAGTGTATGLAIGKGYQSAKMPMRITAQQAVAHGLHKAMRKLESMDRPATTEELSALAKKHKVPFKQLNQVATVLTGEHFSASVGDPKTRFGFTYRKRLPEAKHMGIGLHLPKGVKEIKSSGEVVMAGGKDLGLPSAKEMMEKVKNIKKPKGQSWMKFIADNVPKSMEEAKGKIPSEVKGGNLEDAKRWYSGVDQKPGAASVAYHELGHRKDVAKMLPIIEGHKNPKLDDLAKRFGTTTGQLRNEFMANVHATRLRPGIKGKAFQALFSVPQYSHYLMGAVQRHKKGMGVLTGLGTAAAILKGGKKKKKRFPQTPSSVSGMKKAASTKRKKHYQSAKFDSSFVRRARYRTKGKHLDVYLKRRTKPYRYYDVPPEVFAEFAESASAGKFFNSKLKKYSRPDLHEKTAGRGRIGMSILLRMGLPESAAIYGHLMDSIARTLPKLFPQRLPLLPSKAQGYYRRMVQDVAEHPEALPLTMVPFGSLLIPAYVRANRIIEKSIGADALKLLE